MRSILAMLSVFTVTPITEKKADRPTFLQKKVLQMFFSRNAMKKCFIFIIVVKKSFELY